MMTRKTLLALGITALATMVASEPTQVPHLNMVANNLADGIQMDSLQALLATAVAHEDNMTAAIPNADSGVTNTGSLRLDEQFPEVFASPVGPITLTLNVSTPASKLPRDVIDNLARGCCRTGICACCCPPGLLVWKATLDYHDNLEEVRKGNNPFRKS